MPGFRKSGEVGYIWKICFNFEVLLQMHDSVSEKVK
jgi:hypothetical protein